MDYAHFLEYNNELSDFTKENNKEIVKVINRNFVNDGAFVQNI